VAKSIRVALVNDFMIVLEGLRSILKSSEPEIQVVELDIRKAPRRGVDVTLLDTYGEVETLDERVRALRSMPDNGAIVVFSFSDQPQAVRRALGAGAQGFISKAVPRHEIIDGIKAAARGERAVSSQRTQHAQIDDAVRWPGREIGLTERESELLSLLSTGMTNRQLGDAPLRQREHCKGSYAICTPNLGFAIVRRPHPSAEETSLGIIAPKPSLSTDRNPRKRLRRLHYACPPTVQARVRVAPRASLPPTFLPPYVSSPAGPLLHPPQWRWPNSAHQPMWHCDQRARAAETGHARLSRLFQGFVE
jgi:NarL family two-component system response regulator LiaR